MPDESKKRTPEERSRKMLKEEETIVDLELAVTKEKLKNKDKSKKMLKEEKIIVDLELAVTKEKFKKTRLNERKRLTWDEENVRSVMKMEFVNTKVNFVVKNITQRQNGKPILNLNEEKLSKNIW